MKKKQANAKSPITTYFSDEHDLSRDDINELITQLSNMILDSSSAATSKKKMSYSISPLSQFLIKKVAEEAGATQGSIVESSPLLFAKVVMDSLERRSNSIGTLKVLHKQIASSLKSFTDISPHLKPYTDRVGKMMDEIVEMEVKAVADKNYQGVDSSGYQTLSDFKTTGEEPPYNKEIEKFLGDSKLLTSLFKRYQE